MLEAGDAGQQRPSTSGRTTCMADRPGTGRVRRSPGGFIGGGERDLKHRASGPSSGEAPLSSRPEKAVALTMAAGVWRLNAA
jgi:hypothetical protein